MNTFSGVELETLRSIYDKTINLEPFSDEKYKELNEILKVNLEITTKNKEKLNLKIKDIEENTEKYLSDISVLYTNYYQNFNGSIEKFKNKISLSNITFYNGFPNNKSISRKEQEENREKNKYITKITNDLIIDKSIKVKFETIHKKIKEKYKILIINNSNKIKIIDELHFIFSYVQTCLFCKETSILIDNIKKIDPNSENWHLKFIDKQSFENLIELKDKIIENEKSNKNTLIKSLTLYDDNIKNIYNEYNKMPDISMYRGEDTKKNKNIDFFLDIRVKMLLISDKLEVRRENIIKRLIEDTERDINEIEEKTSTKDIIDVVNRRLKKYLDKCNNKKNTLDSNYSFKKLVLPEVSSNEFMNISLSIDSNNEVLQKCVEKITVNIKKEISNIEKNIYDIYEIKNIYYKLDYSNSILNIIKENLVIK